MTSNVLPLFWNLSSATKSTRLDASEQLITSLEKFQVDYLSASGKGDDADANVDNADEEDDGDEQDDDESGVEVSDDDDEDEDEDMDTGRTRRLPDDEDNAEDAARIRRMDKQFDANNSEDVKYSIKRLIRGLGSSRDSSRLGFAVALTELLSRLSTLPSSSRSIPPSYILSLILRSSTTTTGMKGSEERDLLFARLFGLNALVSSGCIVSCHEAQGRRTWLDTVQAIIELGDKKAWLRESAWFSLVRAVRALLDDEVKVEWKEEAVDALTAKVYRDVVETSNVKKGSATTTTTQRKGLPWTQEKVALTIVLQQLRPNLDWQNLLAPTFKNGNILSSSNLQALGRVLKEAEIETDQSTPSGAPISATGGTGSWKPQPHFVWDTIFDAYFPREGTTVKSKGLSDKVSFQEFFRVVVDESLFSVTSSPSRKFWGFEIFSKTLPLLPKTDLPLVFTQNFMRVWMSQLSGQDRLLHKAALRVAEQIQTVTKQNPLVGFTLLSQLVGRHGSHNFDRLTKTKTVEGIMANLSGDAVGEYVAYLKGLFYQNEEGERLDVVKLEARRSWVFDQLLALLRNSNMTKQDDWVWSILEFLLVHGLFVVSKANKKSDVLTLHQTVKPPVSDNLGIACRSKFFSAVIEATIHTRIVKAENDERSRKLQGSDSAGNLWLERCLKTIEAIEADAKHVTPAIEVDDEIREARKLARKTLASLKKKSNVDRDVARGVQVLLSFALLKSYDDDVKAYEILEDVQRCAERIFGIDSPASSADQEDLPPVDLLVDVLIGYLDRASSDLRALATAVFGLISAKATGSTIEHLIAQLEASGGDAEASDDEDDDMLDAEADEEDDADESSESEEEEDDDEDDNAPVDPEFRRKIAEALQVSGMSGDDEDMDSEDEDSEDDTESITMDDDEMLKLDDKLAEVFRQQKQGKTAAKSSAQESIHFKARVLDLVEAFFKRQPQNPLSLPLIPVLLRLNMEIGTKDKQLGSKAGAILQGRVAGNKEVPVVEDVESAGSVLTAIHDIARGSPSREFLGLCSNCSVYVTKAIAHMPSSSRQPAGAAVEIVTKTYAASLKEVMTKKNSRLHISFISDLIARQPLQAWPLRRDVLKYAGGEGVNDHQQTEAFDLMTAIGKQLTVVSQSVDASEVKDWIAGARKVLYGVLEKESSDDGSWQAPRVNKVIKTALQIARFSKAVLKTSEEVASVWESDKTAELGRKLLQTKRMQNNGSVRTLFGQFELSVSPAAQAAQQRRKDEKKDKKRRRQDGDEAVAEGEAMDVDQEESAATPKKPAKKQAKQAATKGEGQQSRGGGGDKKVKKRKVAA